MNEPNICSICGSVFDLEKEGGMAGEVGVLPVEWCPVCWDATVEAVELYRGPNTRLMDLAAQARESIGELCDILESDLLRE